MFTRKVLFLLFTMSLCCRFAAADIIDDDIFAENFDGAAYCPEVESDPALNAVSSVEYPNSPRSGIRDGVDLTDFASVFGHANSSDALTPFPGVNGSAPLIVRFPGDQTLALQFVAVPVYLMTVRNSSYSGRITDIAISESPYVWPTDFKRVRCGVGPGEAGPTASTELATKALLIPGQTYYWLIRLHDAQPGTVEAAFTNSF